MHFFQKKVRTIMINLHNTGHDPFKLSLVQFDLRNSIKKELNIPPFASINLFPK